MRKYYVVQGAKCVQFIILAFILVFVSEQVFAVDFVTPTNGIENYNTQLQAVIDTNVPSITITWPEDEDATGYTVYRKSLQASSWGSILASLDSDETQYVDTDIVIGTGYEYRVEKSVLGVSNAYGYIYAGIELPLSEERGIVIFIVDQTTYDNLSHELEILFKDMSGDGFVVLPHIIDTDSTVDEVKDIVIDEYTEYGDDITSIFLFGGIPVPYSGQMAPDGHPDHLGAWPADGYYGELTSVWPDIHVNITTATDERNDNVPGDFKFDRSVYPSPVEIAVGRVDLRNMSDFGTALELLERYLEKNHQYRMKTLVPEPQALIRDDFGVYQGEPFAADAWLNFTPLVGDQITISANSENFIQSLTTDTFQWVYGGGGGSYTSVSGVANSSNYASQEMGGMFNMFFGSYFGDWDSSSNNFLKAPLAGEGMGLTSVWSARPRWYFHILGLGEPMSTAIKLTQNNSSGTYYTRPGTAGFVSAGFMGDPTLRMHIVSPVSNVTVATTSDVSVLIDWEASEDNDVIGYHVYKSHTIYGPFERINDALIDDTSIIDDFSAYYPNYIVKAIALEVTPSGSYYNSSHGIHQSLSVYSTPEFAEIDDIESDVNTLSDVIELMVSDDETALAELEFLAQSSNTALLPIENITFEIVDDTMTVVLMPAENEIGSSTVTLTVSDGDNVATQSFVYTVNDVLDATAPPVPILQAEAESGNIVLSWNGVQDTGTGNGIASGLEGYVIYRDSNFIATSSNTSYIDIAVISGLEYTYTITSFDHNGNISNFSDSVVISIPRESSRGGGGGGSSVRKKQEISITPVLHTPSQDLSQIKSTPGTIFTIGDTGDSVRSLQRLLVSTGHLGSQYVTGYYGPLTNTALNNYLSSISTSVITPSDTRGVSDYIKEGMEIGLRDESVRHLQQFLNQQGFLVASVGPGSPGNETTYFGNATKNAVMKFQQFYSSDILTPSGLFNPTGYVGPATLAKIQNIIANQCVNYIAYSHCSPVR